MTLIRNKKFTNIFRGKQRPVNPTSVIDYRPTDYPYIGMGNPDAKVLFVGSEKGFDPKNSPEINLHELILNYLHWSDIVNSHNILSDPFHPILKLRYGSFKGFNPFSPLTLDETCCAVYPKGNHTYKRIEKIFNAILHSYHYNQPKSIFQISPKHYQESIFNYCFITDLSDKPKKNQNAGEKFSYDDFVKTPRYKHLRGPLGDFYKSFNKVVIYAGKNYSGIAESQLRLNIIRLFNEKLTHEDRSLTQNTGDDKWLFDLYDSPHGGAKVIVCNHLISKIFNDNFNLNHLLGVIGIGDIL